MSTRKQARLEARISLILYPYNPIQTQKKLTSKDLEMTFKSLSEKYHSLIALLVVPKKSLYSNLMYPFKFTIPQVFTQTLHIK